MDGISKGANSTSVLFVGIDSISKINLERTMPKTWNFLLNNSFSTLNGFTKVGENTFPNLVAILSGKTERQIYDYCHPEEFPFNTCGLIWDTFKAHGYITEYAEDFVTLNTFNYANRRGFLKAPTDIYLRPYMIASEALPSLHENVSHYCSGPESSAQRIMNSAKDFVATFKDYPKFGLFFMVSFSHDEPNLASSMDDKLAEHLELLYQNLDNNTILIVFSDHGFRFGDFRYTSAGWLEDRLPFIFVHFPEKFKRDHPLQYRNFLTNTQRLTSPFDIYMTLQDILHLGTGYEIKQSQACPKCHSLFEEVDEDRTCMDAGIGEAFCLCSLVYPVNSKNLIVQQAAQFTIDKVNEIVKGDENINTICAFFYVQQVKSALLSETYVNNKNEYVNRLVIMVNTAPFAAFEATLEVLVEESLKLQFRLLGDVIRTNRYGPDIECLQNSHLEQYCYCERLMHRFYKNAACIFKAFC